MNHTALITTMANITSAAQFLSQNYRNIPFVMGEVGTYPGAINNYEVKQSFAATLWNAKFILFDPLRHVPECLPCQHAARARVWLLSVDSRPRF